MQPDIIILAIIVGLVILINVVSDIVISIKYSDERREFEKDYNAEKIASRTTKRTNDRIDMGRALHSGKMTAKEAAYMVEVLEKSREAKLREMRISYDMVCRIQDKEVKKWVSAIVIIVAVLITAIVIGSQQI